MFPVTNLNIKIPSVDSKIKSRTSSEKDSCISTPKWDE